MRETPRTPLCATETAMRAHKRRGVESDHVAYMPQKRKPLTLPRNIYVSIGDGTAMVYVDMRREKCT